MMALRSTGASLRAISAAVEAQHGIKASHEAVRRVLRDAGAL
jgi:transposase